MYHLCIIQHKDGCLAKLQCNTKQEELNPLKYLLAKHVLYTQRHVDKWAINLSQQHLCLSLQPSMKKKKKQS